jgi:coenzyme F420-reducing hydrogenase delta subunit/biotin operon repressor
MCSGRIDLEFILKAFLNGQDGVFVGGCKLDECNYTTHGNYDAYSTVQIGKQILKHLGLNANRLRAEFMSSADSGIIVDTANEFAAQIREMGPLGAGEGLPAAVLRYRLEAARRLVPYIKLVERERLRLPMKTPKAYAEFFAGEEFARLFTELIGDQLTVSQIMQLLAERPHSTAEIASLLDLDQAAVAKYLNRTSRQGLVSYDEDRKSYAIA